jgi:hypothetical protein
LLGGGQILCVELLLELSPPLFVTLQDTRPQRLLSFRLRLECLLRARLCRSPLRF